MSQATPILSLSGAELTGTVRTPGQHLRDTPRADFEWALRLDPASTVTAVTVSASGRDSGASGEWLPMPSRPGSTGDPDVSHALTPSVNATTRDRYTVDDHASVEEVALEFTFTGAAHANDTLDVWLLAGHPLVA